MAYSYVSPSRSVGEVSSLIAGNRLEPRPRSMEFNRSLRAEVRDAAWLLARQWQMKEFQAEDRGSPIGAQVELQYAPLTQLRAGGATAPMQAYDPTARPLDALVQAMPPVVDLGLQLQLGRHWKRLLQTSALPAAAVSQLLATYRELFPIAAAPDDTDSRFYSLPYALSQSLPETRAIQQVAAGRAIAGYDVYTWLTAHGTDALVAYSNATNLLKAQQLLLEALAGQFVAWYGRTYTLPATEPGAWSVPDLAYRFDAAAPGAGGTPVVLTARAHEGGLLQWHSVDEQVAGADPAFTAGTAPTTVPPLHFVPTEIQFAGAPNARWWEFEDRKVDFGQLTADSSDLGRMLLQEFMFLYHNDWFSLPYSVPTGSLCSVTNLLVTDVFGERYRLMPAGANPQLDTAGNGQPLEDDWGHWSLFALSQVGQRQQSVPRLFLPPAAPNPQVGPVVERVAFAREEATNLVWGVESVIPNGLGRGADGAGAAARVSEYLRSRAPAPQPMDSGATREYRLATAVAEHWIPFVPQTDPGSAQLEQGTMLRQVEHLSLQEGDETVQPRTSLLGLPASVPYLVNERTVPPTGLSVEGAFRRTRWLNGETALWYSRTRSQGSRTGGSGLAYDQLLPRPERRTTPDATGTLGVVRIIRNSTGDLASVQAYRLTADNRISGNLVEFTYEQLRAVLLTGETAVLVYPADPVTLPWSTGTAFLLGPDGDVQLAADTPTDGLLGWWRADAGISRDPAGHIAQWADQSGHGRTLFPEPSAAPLATAAWAGGQAVQFEGQQLFALLDLGLPAPPAVFTLVLVLQKTVGAVGMPASFGQNYNVGAAYDAFGVNTWNGDVTGTSGMDSVLAAPVVVAVELPNHHPADLRIWVNGQARAIDFFLNAPSPAVLDSLFRLGGNTQLSQGNYYWQGWMGEALLYDRVLFEAEHTQLAASLAQRYALNLPTPPAQPYVLKFIGLADWATYGDTTSFLDLVEVVDGNQAVVATALQNADFEQPAVGSYRYNIPASESSWALTGGLTANGSAFNAPAAPSGVQVCFLQAESRATQALNLSPGTYRVRFKAAQRATSGANHFFGVYVNDELLLQVQPPADGAYHEYLTTTFHIA